MELKRYKEFIVLLGSIIFISICVFSGFIVADKNTRRVCFGDNSPILQSNFNEQGDLEIKVSVFGLIHKLSVNFNDHINYNLE